MAKWKPAGEETWRDVIEWRARLFPNKLAVVSHDTGKQFTFKELNQRANSLANALTDLGVAKGDRVAVLATDIPEYLEIASTSKAGNVCVPVSWRLKEQEIVHIINDSGANTVFVGEHYLNTIRSSRSQLPNVKRFICIDANPDDMLSYEELISSYPPDDPCIEVSPNDILAIIYTSGTTGLPKGVIKTHRESLCFIRLLDGLGQIINDDRCLFLWPMFHVGLIHANFVCIWVGATQWLIQRFDPEAVLEIIHRAKITNLGAVPTMIIRLMEHPNRAKYDLSSLRSIIYTGSPMPTEALRKALDIFGPILYQGFGMTEATGQTVLSVEDHIIALKKPGMERILASVGKPFPGCEMRLVDDDDNDVPAGTPGEIVFCSDCMAEGYWNKPEETKELLKNGWMHTGDIGRLDEDGYLYIVDRKKDLIISGGENISSREIEDVIYTHPAVLECTVIGVPSDKWGEEVKAVVALREGMMATSEEIMNHCAEHLGGFKKPKSVEIWPELPKNPVGKILKREVREKFWAGRERRVH